MKKILETLERKWAEYLLEIIVISIIGAFALESWRESRAEKKIEKILSSELGIEPAN